MSLMLHVLRFLPKNLLSRLFGRLAAAERPRWFALGFRNWFARRFGLDLSIAEKSLDEYPSLLALFTRSLKPGARPIADPTRHLVSPVDGVIGAYGSITRGRLIQAKGIDYSLGALLGDEEAAHVFDGGFGITIYLSPRDYHRIHAPCGGLIKRTLYEPGTLWPVNPPAVRRIPALFAVNERVTTWIDTPERGPAAVVMVGATNVGSISLSYDALVTNCGEPRVHKNHEGPQVRAGDHLGTFQLGSTVVLLFPPAMKFQPNLEEGRWVAMGSSLGIYGA